ADRLVLLHTEVPAALGGRGLGGRLVRAAVERASGEGLTVVPLCPFARTWLERHPDVAENVTVDWGEPPEDWANTSGHNSARSAGQPVLALAENGRDHLGLSLDHRCLVT